MWARLIGSAILFLADLFGIGSEPKLFISRLSIGPDTTVLKEPVKPDGSIDYGAAINELASAGVTVENNAVVLLDRAIGPSHIPRALRGRFYQLLGTRPPASDGNCCVSFGSLVESDYE